MGRALKPTCAAGPGNDMQSNIRLACGACLQQCEQHTNCELARGTKHGTPFHVTCQRAGTLSTILRDAGTASNGCTPTTDPCLPRAMPAPPDQPLTRPAQEHLESGEPHDHAPQVRPQRGTHPYQCYAAFSVACYLHPVNLLFLRGVGGV